MYHKGMIEFYVIRHGQTVYNTQMVLQGVSDSPLTDLGIAQTEACRDYLKKTVCFDYVYSSPAPRAIATARIIIDDEDFPIIIEDDFRERNYGIFDGHFMSREERDRRDFFNQDLHDVGGESYKDVEIRTFMALKRITKEIKDGSKVLIISHGDAIYSLCHAVDLKKSEEEGIRFLNCSITRITYEDGEYKLICLPQTDYLEK